MSRTSNKIELNTKKKVTVKPQPSTQSPEGVFGRIVKLWSQYDRFGWDILGIGIISIATLTLLGLLGLTKGAFLTPWVFFLRRWLGWGSYFGVVFIGLLGLLTLLRRYTEVPGNQLAKILALEGMILALIALFSVLGGHSLDRAVGGLDGGLIGWGIAELFGKILPTPLNIFFILLIFVIFLLYGLGLVPIIIRRVEGWLQIQNELETKSFIDSSVFPHEEIPDIREDQAKKISRIENQQNATLSQVNEKKMMPQIQRDKKLPPINLLMYEDHSNPNEENIHTTAVLIEKTLLEFGVPSRVVGFRVGPTVTQFAVEPGFIEKLSPEGKVIRQKVRISQISRLTRDLSLALSTERLRIEAPVPGHSFVGIEIPNEDSSVVRLRSMLVSEVFQHLSSPLAIALGRDVSGKPVVADLTRMPHLLISGSTGSGKSVCISSLIICLVMNNTPKELRFTILDPKMVEMLCFNGLPHIYHQVETEPERMLAILRWTLMEMDSRYRLFEAARARDLESYNRQLRRKKQEILPRIVVVIDELADLMMSFPVRTENYLVRLAQLARATGIHLIVATQRPSADVVTGLIKANFPARIAFKVPSSVDSRVILDTNGAETLLGCGDMLFLDPEIGIPIRAQGVMVTNHEIERVVNIWQKMSQYEKEAAPWEDLIKQKQDGSDDLMQQAIDVVRNARRASASMLQRRLRIGYPRAARIIDELESLGIVGPAKTGGKEREVRLSSEEEMKANNSKEGNNAPA